MRVKTSTLKHVRSNLTRLYLEAKCGDDEWLKQLFKNERTVTFVHSKGRSHV